MFTARLATPPPSSSLPNSPGAGTSTSRVRGGTLSGPPSLEPRHQNKRRRINDPPSRASSCSTAHALPISPRTPGKKMRLTIKGTVTPSRAAPFFQIRTSHQQQQQPSSNQSSSPTSHSHSYSQTSSSQKAVALQAQASPRSVLQLSSPTPRRINRAFSSKPRLGDARTEYLQSLLRRPAPAASAFYAAGNPALTLQALRTNSNPLHFGASLPSSHAPASRALFARPTRDIDTRAYLSSFASRQELDWYELESSWQTETDPSSLTPPEPALAHPLCCAYSYSSKAADPSAQWLAIGDNESRIILLNTLDDTTADEFTGSPQWHVSGRAPANGGSNNTYGSSVYELAWRHDDLLLASGASNYSIAVWDVRTQSCTEVFAGPRGSARSIQWDPASAGNLLCSGGRDGAIHLFDRRVRPGESCASSSSSRRAGAYAEEETRPLDGNDLPSAVKPVLSIWGAHTSSSSSSSGNSKSALKNRTKPLRGRKHARQDAPQRGVTSLAYLPGRPHCIVSAGCEDGRVRVWDLRASVEAGTSESVAVAGIELGKEASRTEEGFQCTFYTSSRSEGSRGMMTTARLAPKEESLDVSRQGSRNLSPHGISSLVVGNNTIFAACTDANIYSLNASSLLSSLPPTSSVVRQAPLPSRALHHPAQKGNTLYARLALDPQEQVLAVGCYSGKVVLYDVKCKAGVGGGGLDMGASSTGVVLEGGHLPNVEINGVSWAHGPQGATLATIADDFTVRTWRPDRVFSQRDNGEGVTPLELGSDEEFEWEAEERRVWRGGELDEWDEEEEWDGDGDGGSSDEDLDRPMRGGRSSCGGRFAFDSD
ncbi:hypothetical protein CF327_g2545 [Tilletia walkeri]|nr:hypothetical protein CF327_g2545 [Tilletia walkeri]